VVPFVMWVHYFAPKTNLTIITLFDVPLVHWLQLFLQSLYIFLHIVGRNLLNFKSWLIYCNIRKQILSKCKDLLGSPCYLQLSEYVRNFVLSWSKCMRRINEMILQGKT
jgi:hypothetical protein